MGLHNIVFVSLLVRLNSRIVALVFAALAYTVRATSALRFLLFGLYLFYNCKDKLKLIFEVSVIGVVILLFNFILDGIFYGEWTIVLLNFHKFNSELGVSALYGTYPFYWYFVEAIPVLLTTYLPFFFYGIYLCSKHPSLILLYCGLVEVVILSFNVHKEYRFIMPLLPVMLLFVAHGGYSFFIFWKKSASKAPKLFSILSIIVQMILYIIFGCIHQQAPIGTISFLKAEFESILSALGTKGIATVNNLDMLLQFPQPNKPNNSTFGHSVSILNTFSFHRVENNPVNKLHQTSYAPSLKIKTLISNFPLLYHVNTKRPLSVHFLMNCHATPFYSSLHLSYYIPMRILDCSPPYVLKIVIFIYFRLAKNDGVTFIVHGSRTTETRSFIDSPLSFVERFYRDPQKTASNRKDIVSTDLEVDIDSQEWLPTHLVLHEYHEPILRNWLFQNNYSVKEKLTGAFTENNSPDSGSILIYTCII